MLYVTIFYFHSFAKSQHGSIVGEIKKLVDEPILFSENGGDWEGSEERKKEMGAVDLAVIKAKLLLFIENVEVKKRSLEKGIVSRTIYLIFYFKIEKWFSK